MNILNKQIDSIYDRQKNLYSKYPHYICVAWHKMIGR
jgi:hypothetical protein